MITKLERSTLEENMGPNTKNVVATAKKCYSTVGIALLVIAVLTVVVQIVLAVAAQVWAAMGLEFVNSTWFSWLSTFVPLYLIGVPIGLLILRRVPMVTCSKMKLGGKNFWVLLLMCFPMMYFGNLVGTLLSTILSGGSAQNGLMNYAMDTSLLKVAVMVIVAPLVEEYVFRKQLIDRCGRYGEKTAIVFSAITFALFHMNLFQFFYAFGMGLIFAYAYIRTNSLRYPVMMHMVINFMGSVLAPWVLSHVDLEALANMNSQAMDEAALASLLPGMMLLLGYMALQLGLAITGLVLLIVKGRQLVFLPAEEELPQNHRLKVVYGNWGFLLFTIFCAVIFGVNLFL